MRSNFKKVETTQSKIRSALWFLETKINFFLFYDSYKLSFQLLPEIEQPIITCYCIPSGCNISTLKKKISTQKCIHTRQGLTEVKYVPIQKPLKIALFGIFIIIIIKRAREMDV